MIVEEKSAGMGFGTSLVCPKFICKINTIKPPIFGTFNAVIYDLSKYGTHEIFPKKADVVRAMIFGTKNKSEALHLHNELSRTINELGENGESLEEILTNL